MSLVTAPVTDEPLALRVPALPAAFTVTISEEAMAQRKDAIEMSQSIVSVANETEQQDAVAAQSLIKGLVKRIDATHKKVKEPALKACQAIDAARRNYVQALELEEKRLGRLLTGYQTDLTARVEAERAKELAEMAAQPNRSEEQMRADAERAAELNQPLKVAGARVTQEWAFEVIDALELAQARPDLVTIEPKIRELKAALELAHGLIPGVAARLTSSVRAKASV